MGEDIQSTDALYTATVKNAIAHVPIHTAHMHTHKQVHNYASSGSLRSYYDKSKSCPLVLLCDYVCYKQVQPSAALASLCTLRPAYGRSQRVQCFNL